MFSCLCVGTLVEKGGREECSRSRGWLEGTGLATAQGLLCSLDLVFQGESVS